MKTNQSSGGIFTVPLELIEYIFQFHLSDFPKLFSSMWKS